MSLQRLMVLRGHFAAALLPAVSAFVGVVIAAAAVSLVLGAEPPSKQSIVAETNWFLKSLPLSADTWFTWRDHFVRIFFEPVASVDEWIFYRKMEDFALEKAAKPGSPAVKRLESDPVYWACLANAYLHKRADVPPFDLAEKASRKGVELGDPSGIASYGLAVVLLSQGEMQSASPTAGPVVGSRLNEVESLLSRVQQLVPNARLSHLRGRLEFVRGHVAVACRLLRRSTEEDPLNEFVALSYLSHALTQADLPFPATSVSDPFVKRFPNDPGIEAMHAIALYRDQRFAEAADTLRRALAQDATVVQMIGSETVQAIEKGQETAPKFASGFRAINERRYDAAIATFREICAEQPQNAGAAHLLAQAELARIDAQRARRDRAQADEAVREIASLCQKFPRDGDLQADYALALYFDHQFAPAHGALLRAEHLGANVAKVIGPTAVAAIHGAQPPVNRLPQTARRRAPIDDLDLGPVSRFVLKFFAVWGTWIAIMFAVGTILAIAIPREPTAFSLDEYSRSGREIWLERFYLVVLGLGLVAFYLVVPFVAVGLLSVTLAVFIALAMARIIHYGVMHRGMWATWGIVRCAFLASQENTLRTPVTEDEHPRLFEASREVAARLNTDAADAVYLTPTSQIGVYQRGSGPFGLFGKKARVLEIGVATLPLLTISEFKSILAHEYGHFTHRDPFFGRFIHQVTLSLAASIGVMNAAGGALNYVNPIYWFYWLHLRAYNLVSAGFSRSREFLADRRAAIAYGKQAFAGGLFKVTVDGGLYDATAYHNVQWMLSNKQMFANVFQAYREWRDTPDLIQKRDSLLQQARQKKTSWFDTHPNFSERLAAIALFPDERSTPENDSAADLLTDSKAVESRLTKMLTQRLMELQSRSR